MRTWLLLDCNYLCYRAWYTTGGLSHGGIQTGVLFGFMRDITTLQDRFNTDLFAFCFDRGRPLRERDYPQYKSGRRKDWTEEDIEMHKLFKSQVKQLRTEHLSDSLQSPNVFSQPGYEADDVIASICHNGVGSDQFIIVSADHDLYQLLGPSVSIFNPGKGSKSSSGGGALITEKSFSKEYGVSPTQWVDVKAIAGCSSDSIEGIKGIGEKTAAKFINGSLKTDSVSFEKIVKGNKIWKSNRHIVKLPYPGVNTFQLTPEGLSQDGWRELATRMGMRTLKQPPKTKGEGFGIF